MLASILSNTGHFIAVHFAHYVQQTLFYGRTMYDLDWILENIFNGYMFWGTLFLTFGIAWFLAFRLARHQRKALRVVAFALPMFNLWFPFITTGIGYLLVLAVILAVIGGILYGVWLGFLYLLGSLIASGHATSTSSSGASASPYPKPEKVIGRFQVDAAHLDKYTYGISTKNSVFMNGKDGWGWYDKV